MSLLLETESPAAGFVAATAILLPETAMRTATGQDSDEGGSSQDSDEGGRTEERPAGVQTP